MLDRQEAQAAEHRTALEAWAPALVLVAIYVVLWIAIYATAGSYVRPGSTTAKLVYFIASSATIMLDPITWIVALLLGILMPWPWMAIFIAFACGVALGFAFKATLPYGWGLGYAVLCSVIWSIAAAVRRQRALNS